MSIRVLIVDDEEDLLDQAKTFMEKIDQDIDVITALSARDAFDILDEKEVDVIVSDYKMPDINGIEFLKRIRENDDIPFIILTGMSEEDVVMDALNHGADGYLKKVGKTETMYDLLTNAIHREYDRWKTEKELHKNRRKVEELHWVASKLISCEEEDKAYSFAMDAAEKILNFDYCGISEVVDGFFKRRAITSNLDPDDLAERRVEDGGIDRETWVKKKNFLIDDLKEVDKANPVVRGDEFRSIISVPVNDIGVFQAISKEPSYFDEGDLQMVEILISHLSNSIKRIRAKKELTKKEQLYRNIFETSGSAMALIDDDMEITHSNDEFTRLFGYYDTGLENKNFLDLVVAQDEKRVKDYCQTLKNETDGFPVQFDMQINTQNGEIKHVFVTLGHADEVDRFVFSLLEVKAQST